MNLTLREKILQTLLKSPKSTGEIAKELGYTDKNGNGKYNVVSPDLGKLEASGLIHSQKVIRGTHGPPPTIYNIVHELPIIQKLLEKHPILIQDLQINDTILSMLVERHSWIFKLPIQIPSHYKFDDDRNAKIDIPSKELNNSYTNKAKKDLRLKLELSNAFFKIFLLNEPDTLKNIFDEIFWQTEEGQLYKFIRESLVREQHANSKLFPPSPRDHPTNNFYSKCSAILFKSCIYYDTFTGNKNNKAIEYIKKMIRDEILKEMSKEIT